MYSIIIACSLLLTLPGNLASAKPLGLTASAFQTTPEKAFTTLCNDAAELMSRALAEPNDAKAMALLQSGSAPILQRRQQISPAFSKWIKSLSPAQRQAFAKRMLVNNNLIKYLQSIEDDKQLNARVEHNPKLMAAFDNLMQVMNLE